MSSVIYLFVSYVKEAKASTLRFGVGPSYNQLELERISTGRASIFNGFGGNAELRIKFAKSSTGGNYPAIGLDLFGFYGLETATNSLQSVNEVAHVKSLGLGSDLCLWRFFLGVQTSQDSIDVQLGNSSVSASTRATALRAGLNFDLKAGHKLAGSIVGKITESSYSSSTLGNLNSTEYALLLIFYTNLFGSY